MVFREIGAIFDGILNMGYKLLILVIIIIGFIIGTFIAPAIGFLLGVIWAVLVLTGTISWRVSTDPPKWTFRSLMQGFRDWREGRRRRKGKERSEIYGD